MILADPVRLKFERTHIISFVSNQLVAFLARAFVCSFLALLSLSHICFGEGSADGILRVLSLLDDGRIRLLVHW